MKKEIKLPREIIKRLAEKFEVEEKQIRIALKAKLKEENKMNKEIKLTIKYNGGIDKKLDNTLEKLVKSFGWKFEGSGFDFKTEVRDLVFYQSIKSIITITPKSKKKELCQKKRKT